MVETNNNEVAKMDESKERDVFKVWAELLRSKEATARVPRSEVAESDPFKVWAELQRSKG